MSTAGEMLDWCRRHLGYVEGPRNNETPFGAHTGYQFQPWCGSFTDTGFDEIGMGSEPSSVYTPSGAAGYQRAGAWISRGGPVQPGDVVYFDWQGGTSARGVDHVGIVEAVLPDGRIQTIEGNTSATDRGSQSNGGGVYRRQRPRGVIAGFGRPHYDLAPVPPPQTPPAAPAVDWAAVRRMAAAGLHDSMAVQPNLDGSTPPSLRVVVLQRALNLVSGAGLEEDGVYGPATIAAVLRFQQFFNITGDFPGAAHEHTRFFLVASLANIRDGKA